MHCLSNIYSSISIYVQHKNSLRSIITIWLKTYRLRFYGMSESETLPSRLFLNKMSYTTTLLPRSGWRPELLHFDQMLNHPVLAFHIYKRALKLPPRRPLSHMPKPTFSARSIIPDLIHLSSFLNFYMKNCCRKYDPWTWGPPLPTLWQTSVHRNNSNQTSQCLQWPLPWLILILAQ